MNLKRFCSATAAVGTLLALITACQNDKEGEEVAYMLPKTQKMTLTAEQNAQLRKNNEFAFDLLRHAYAQQEAGQDRGKSLFVSPMGVTYMLGMLNTGANEETRQEIAQTLHAEGKSANEINQLCLSVLTQAPKVDPSVQILSANAIYLNKGYEIEPQYQSDMNKYYQAEARVLDFTQSQSLNVINNWAKKQTHDMVPKALDNLNSSAACYLLNSVYFQATWTKQFDREKTTKQPFTKANGQQTEVDMMHNRALVYALSTDNSLVIRMGYGSDAWSMYVIMPKEGKTLNDVLDNLDVSLFENRWGEATLDLQLPKFQTTCKTNLKDVLTQMGLTSVFNPMAKLTGICKDRSFCVSKMEQNGKINVDEEGTKATMVTISEIGCTSPGPSHNTIEDFNGEFHANRPFVYLIREGYSGAIFFTGIYTGE